MLAFWDSFRKLQFFYIFLISFFLFPSLSAGRNLPEEIRMGGPFAFIPFERWLLAVGSLGHTRYVLYLSIYRIYADVPEIDSFPIVL